MIKRPPYPIPEFMSQKVLIIGSVWPEPNSSAAGSRMMQLIELFLKEDWRITFASPANHSDFSFDIEGIGIAKVNIQLNSGSFDEFIKDLQPTIVLFDRFLVEEQFGWRITENCPDALKILDTEDLHCLRQTRQKAFKEKRKYTHADLLTADIAKREIASILRCDISLIISTVEMDLLLHTFKIDSSLLYYLPFMLDAIEEEDMRTFPSYEERTNFISIGNFLHEPNWNSVLFLKEEIWPLIRKKLPKAELHIYGAYPSQKVLALHQPKDGFLIKGRAESVEDVMAKARVCLAPLRFGAGIKGKLIDAMQYGTPSVTTSIGAEAMHQDFEWNGFIADTAESFAVKAAELYTDNYFWQAAQQRGVKIINTCYPKIAAGKALIDKIKFLQTSLKAHRTTNFVGALLQHHTTLSTKYMSKWIEEKNK